MDDEQHTAPATEPVVVAMPEEIDVTNSSEAGWRLSLALLVGATTVIADFSATTFCDSSGVREVALAWRRAADMNAELQLVVPPGAVLRIMALTGLDKLISVYESLDAARAGGCAALVAPDSPQVA